MILFLFTQTYFVVAASLSSGCAEGMVSCRIYFSLGFTYGLRGIFLEICSCAGTIIPSYSEVLLQTHFYDIFANKIEKIVG